jgi:hypothetical protein
LIQLSGIFGPTKNQNEIFAFNEAKVCQTGTARRFRELTPNFSSPLSARAARKLSSGEQTKSDISPCGVSHD